MDIRTLYLTFHKARPFMARPIKIFFLIIATSTSLHKPLNTIFEDNSEKMWIKQDKLKVKDMAKNLGKENLLQLLSTMPEGQSHKMWKRQDDHKAKHLEGQLEDLVRILSVLEENLDNVEEAQLKDLEEESSKLKAGSIPQFVQAEDGPGCKCDLEKSGTILYNCLAKYNVYVFLVKT